MLLWPVLSLAQLKLWFHFASPGPVPPRQHIIAVCNEVRPESVGTGGVVLSLAPLAPCMRSAGDALGQ